VFAQTFQGNGSLRSALGFWLGGARLSKQQRPAGASHPGGHWARPGRSARRAAPSGAL